MNRRHTVASFDGKYGRRGLIWIEPTECNSCGYSRPCIGVDASEEEYNPGYICLVCAAIGVEGWHKKEGCVSAEPKEGREPL